MAKAKSPPSEGRGRVETKKHTGKDEKRPLAGGRHHARVANETTTVSCCNSRCKEKHQQQWGEHKGAPVEEGLRNSTQNNDLFVVCASVSYTGSGGKGVPAIGSDFALK